MDNFKFYFLTRKLGVAAGACFNELQRVHREAAPCRATVFDGIPLSNLIYLKRVLVVNQGQQEHQKQFILFRSC